MIPHKNGLLVFIEMKQKKFYFEKRNSKWPTQKKHSFSSSANSQYFFMNRLVELIDVKGNSVAQSIWL